MIISKIVNFFMPNSEADSDFDYAKYGRDATKILSFIAILEYFKDRFAPPLQTRGATVTEVCNKVCTNGAIYDIRRDDVMNVLLKLERARMIHIAPDKENFLYSYDLLRPECRNKCEELMKSKEFIFDEIANQRIQRIY